jgi:hypothetical protein
VTELADRLRAPQILVRISESSFRHVNRSTFREQTLLTRDQKPHPRSDDRERITRARQTAEALFKAKPSVSTPPGPDTSPADQSVRKPRVLRIIPPSPTGQKPESPVVAASLAREIPRSQFARIRTLAKYGMTVAQVAQVYGVAAGDIQRILRRG